MKAQTIVDFILYEHCEVMIELHNGQKLPITEILDGWSARDQHIVILRAGSKREKKRE